jgi:hypothetical protein
MYIPRLFWVAFNRRNGINLYSLVDAALKYESLDSFAEKEKIMVYLCKNLLRSIQMNEFKHKNDYTSTQLYKNSRAELSKLLNMKPELRAENSKQYNKDLSKVIEANRTAKNKSKKVVIINSGALENSFQVDAVLPSEARSVAKQFQGAFSKKLAKLSQQQRCVIAYFLFK